MGNLKTYQLRDIWALGGATATVRWPTDRLDARIPRFLREGLCSISRSATFHQYQMLCDAFDLPATHLERRRSDGCVYMNWFMSDMKQLEPELYKALLEYQEADNVAVVLAGGRGIYQIPADQTNYSIVLKTANFQKLRRIKALFQVRADNPEYQRKVSVALKAMRRKTIRLEFK